MTKRVAGSLETLGRENQDQKEVIRVGEKSLSKVGGERKKASTLLTRPG